jgi:cyclopropane fatty-acyl-phospholipid synthase-like methyltransferase
MSSGLNLLKKRSFSGLTFERGDVLAPYAADQHCDLVYSVGLIEHFDPFSTERAILADFDRCKPGGLVLITFPTPTALYRAIRAAAEWMGKWLFPDERPLQFGEVLNACKQRGTILHTSINWWIGLTQGYVLIKNRTR